METFRLKAETLLASLERDHPPAVVEVLRDLLSERFPRGRGKSRPSPAQTRALLE